MGSETFPTTCTRNIVLINGGEQFWSELSLRSISEQTELIVSGAALCRLRLCEEGSEGKSRPSLPVTQWPAEWPEVQHSGSVTLPPPSKHTPLSEPERAWHAKRQGIGMIKRDQPENRKVFYVPTHPLPKLWNNSPAGVWLFCYQTSLKVSRVEPRLNRSWFQVVSVFKKGVVLVMFFWSCKLGHFHQFHYESVYLLNSVKRWLPTSYQVITAEICSSVEELPVCQRLFSLTSSFKRHHTAVCCSLLFTLRLCS